MVELVSLNDYTLTVRVDGEREYTLYTRGDRTVVLDYDIVEDRTDAAWIYDAIKTDGNLEWIGLSSSYFVSADELPRSMVGDAR